MFHRSETATPVVTPRALRERDAAAFVGLSIHTLRNTRCADMARRARGEPIQGPTWANAGRAVLYLVRDLEKWLDERRVA